MTRPMSSLALVLLGAWALVVGSGCPERDLCAEAPLCEEGLAINCELGCSVGPCSNGPRIRECSARSECEIVPGPLSSTRFFRTRALCVLEATGTCDPATAPPPTCDGLGTITGCSAYRRVIEASCTQANLFFQDTSCCTHPPDAGTSGDGGTPGDGGTADGGGAADGGDGGR